MPSNISTGKGPPLPLPSLRLMIPPLRLVSAAIWQTVQRRHVMDYGVLEEFVTMVTAMVPELLSHRQKAQLILGLQARLVLELCRSKPMADLQTIQLHLDRIQTLTPLWGGQTGDVDLSGSNFLALIENLLEDPDEMEHFFQVFPVEFGPDYDAEIEIVMWKFLSRLEELLPVSNFQQAASLLGDAPSVLKEGVESVSDPQHLKTLIQYHRELGLLDDHATPPSSDGDCILSALCFSRVEKVRSRQPDHKPTVDSVEHEDMEADAGTEEENALDLRAAGKGVDGTSEEVDPRNERLIGYIREDGVLMTYEDLGVKKKTFKRPQIILPDAVTSSVHCQPSVDLQRLDSMIQTLTPVRSNTGIKTKNFLEKTQTKTNCRQMQSCASNTSRHLKSHSQDEVYRCSYCTRTYRHRNNMRVHEETCLIEKGPPGKVPCVEGASPSGTTQKDPKTLDVTPQQLSTGALEIDSSRENQETEISQSPVVSKSLNLFSINTTFQLSPADKILPSHTTFETKTQSYKDTESLKKHGLKCEDTKESHCRSVASDEMNLKMYSRIFPEVSSNSQDLRDNPSSEPDPNQTRTHQQHLPNPVSVKPRMGLHPHTCPHCQKKFMFIRALRTHQLTHNPLFCTLCRMKFADQDKLDRHKRVAHKPLKCTMCEDVFDWIKPLNQHYLNVHQFSGPFLCTYCQKSFSTLSARVTHERTHTGDLPYQCSQCPKKYNKSADLVEHRKLHTGEKPCLCWECGQAFTNEMKLRNHMLNVHRKPQHPCSQCDKCYGEKRTLVSHVKTCHSGVRYPCARCAKTFTSASSLTIHERIHSQQKPFKCTESECGKDFRSKKELTVHVRYHTGERPFSCQVCGKGFTQSCYLTQHMRTHTGEKPYSCSVCARSFNDSRKLKRHMMTHTKEKPYKCLRCDRAFCRPDLLKAHDKKEHVTH
ncbi:zinc finger protein 271 isoform X2 [Esox lucius]|uniref:zinc finger protein 271 isoform X2 n=1 Tax=Esox lucius TaxID=8010 RepID=UPI00097341DA|nr:zinc finger protein 271 isoform X2 [Esox lucius]